MDDSEQFTKFHNKDNTIVFRVATEWSDPTFKLSVLVQSSAWIATVTEDHINNLAEQHEIVPKVYFGNLKRYFCHDQSNITVDVKDKQFILYRSTSNEKLRLKYFFVNLEKISYENAVGLFLDSLVAKYNGALSFIDTMQAEKIEAITQKLLLEKRCEEFAELKRKSDLQMYSAFTLVLNEKKQRIRFLTELLECPNKKVFVTSKNELSGNDEFVNGRKREVLSDSDSNKSVEYNTDDEKPPLANKFECKPSTSRGDYDFLGGDSPPPLLPKRIKIDQSIAQDVNKIGSHHGTTKVKTTLVEAEPTPMSDDDQSNFNTQELLDRM